MTTEDRLTEAERIIRAFVDDPRSELVDEGHRTVCRHCSGRRLNLSEKVVHAPDCPYVAAQAWLASKPPEPVKRKLSEVFESLRLAGGSAWDDIDDPEAYIREFRGG